MLIPAGRGSVIVAGRITGSLTVVKGELHDLLDGVALLGSAEGQPSTEGEHGDSESAVS